eukprot:TRINITY_DN18605_c0_g2_i2.p2 TRINITY_DN18605_c0_g2~~TRINITY_DN18605_c0_g2_i2.p2  ORF type:complete len:392 (+),score=119.66 TRINITY_DN18605_c0_g2_i2:77-1177(+)
MFYTTAFAPAGLANSPVHCDCAVGAALHDPWEQLHLCQGILSEMQTRLGAAELALGREAAGRQRAERRLAVERRKARALRGELREAGRRAAVAEERCLQLAAELASAAAPPQRVDEAATELCPPTECEGPAGEESEPLPLTEQPAERALPVEEKVPPVAEPPLFEEAGSAELAPPVEAMAAESPCAAGSTAGGEQPAAPQPPGDALRERLQCWVQGIPIGGNPATTSQRTYDIETLACFAEANGMEQSEPEHIYRAFVDGRAKQWDAEAAGGVSAAGGQPDPEPVLRAPSPREGLPEAAGGTGRRLGMPLQPSRSDDSDWSMVDAPASPLPAGPPAGGAWGWLPHFPAAVGHVAAAAAGALAAAGR